MNTVKQKTCPFSISCIEDLSSLLGVSSDRLKFISQHKNLFYTKIELYKKGKLRTIYAPKTEFGAVLRSIDRKLLRRVPLSEPLHGYRVGCSPRSNAQAHLGNIIMCKLDIKNFFPSIHYTKVKKLFGNIGCSEEVARLLTTLTTVDYTVPHGFNTSPSLSNIVLSNLANRLKNLCEKYRLVVTLYSDDITISGNLKEEKLRKIITNNLIPAIREISKQEGFRLNPEKIKILGKRDRREVTGLTINEKINLPKGSRKELLHEIRRLQTIGIQQKDDPLKKKQSLRGKIAFAQSINPSFGKRLLAEFEKIVWPC